MKRLTLIFACILFTFSTSLNAKVKPVCKIIPQTDLPIQMRKYNAKYIEGEISHEFYGTVISERKIIAVEFCFVSYNIWDEYLGRLNGVSIMEMPKDHIVYGTWTHNCYGDFGFHTGFVFLNKVRYEDGEIWISDKNEVLQELRKFDENFDMAKLERKEDE
jgi:hypothetical protein